MTLRLTRADLALGGATPVYAETGVRDGGYAVHHHEFIEMVLILAGDGVHVGPRGEEILAAGDLLLLRPGSWHGYVRCRGLRLWDCCFDAALLDRELAWLMHEPGCAQLLWQLPLADGSGQARLRLPSAGIASCLPVLDSLRGLHRSGGQRLAQIAALIGLFAAIAPLIPPAARQRPVPAVAQRAIELLASAPAQAWTAQGLARRLGVDPAYLSRAVAGTTGLPPMGYLARLRAERAAALLSSGDQDIASIAAAVGWHDPVRFARRFKAHFGVTATAYRASRRSGSAT